MDLCNEWPGELWAPYFKNDPPSLTWGGWWTEASMHWMERSCEIVRKAHPNLAIGYSFEPKDRAKLSGKDLSFLDYADPHLWMAQANNNEFNNEIGYNFDRFSLKGYEAISAKAEAAYRRRPDYWQGLLRAHILSCSDAFRPHKIPLVTTECWAVVDYKDWPMLNWNWVRDLCEIGVETAAATGQWLAIGTSNFTGPQFRGMWREVEWHKRLTSLIKGSRISPEFKGSALYQSL